MRKALLAPLIVVLIAAQSLADSRDEGKDIFETICKICHQLPAPESLTAKQWEFVLKTMEKRMEQKDMAPLDPGEKEKVMLYLMENARK